MENIVLTIHLLLAVALIGVVLLQRSEGGGLGIGGGGGGAMTGRGAATALSKVTWFLAIGFLVTSMTLTIIAAQKSSSESIIDRLGAEGTGALTPTLEEALTPPAPSDEPATPPAAD